MRLYELIKEEKIAPELVIAVPVGFVNNVVQSKELILSLENTPYIVARGRKGGSNIADVDVMHFCTRETEEKEMKKPYFPMFVDLSGRTGYCSGRGQCCASPIGDAALFRRGY